MALVYRYLGFVEYKENLPKGVEVVRSFFLNEICGINTESMKKAIKWLQAQEGFNVEAIAHDFYFNFLWIVQTEIAGYFRLASCLNELTDFESIVTQLARKTVFDFDMKPVHNQPIDHCTLRTLDLANGFYRLGILSSEHFFRFIYVIMSSKLPVNQRITLLLRLQVDVVENLKRDGLVERIVSTIGIVRASSGMEGIMTMQELHKMTHALICFDLIPHDTLKYDKMEKLGNIFDQWRNGSLNLKKTLAAFSALEFKFYEEFTHIANEIWFYALDDDQHQLKLAILLVHLQNEIFKDHEEFEKVLTDLVTTYIYRTFSSKETTVAGDTNMAIVRFLIILYNEGVIQHDLIETTLSLLTELPREVGYHRFVRMFPVVQAKLKRESSREVYEEFVDFMNMKTYNIKNKVMSCSGYLEKVPSLKEWLMKNEMENTEAANSSKSQQAAQKMKKNPPSTTMESADIDEATHGYCQEPYTLDELLQHFEAFETITDSSLEFIAHSALEFAMKNNAPPKKLAISFKDLINKTFVDIAEELHRVSLGVFHHHIEKHLEHTSEMSLETNMCFVKFLAELFIENVIDEKLIVKSLDMLMEDCSGPADDCFTELFTKVGTKLRETSEWKFQEYTEHLENYILNDQEDDEMSSECSFCVGWDELNRKEEAKNGTTSKQETSTPFAHEIHRTVGEVVPAKENLEEKARSSAAKDSTMAYRYLGLVKSDEITRVFNEICGKQPSFMKKVLMWAQKQEGWNDDQTIAKEFFDIYLIAANPASHIPTAIACLEVIPGFKDSLSKIIREEMFDMLHHDLQRGEGKDLLLSASLAGELYPYELASDSEIFDFFGLLQYLPKLSNPRRIEIFDAILKNDATKKFLIKRGIAQRLLYSLSMPKARNDFGDPMTHKEIDALIDALTKINFFTKEVLQQDKTQEFQVAFKNWCNRKANMEDTLAAIASCDFKYPEQFRHVASTMLFRALQDIGGQDKLANLQAHLRKNTYKSIQQLVDETWRDFLEYLIPKYDQNCPMLLRAKFVRYLSSLYMRKVIDSSLIIKSLNSFAETPNDLNNPMFTAMFTTVEEKLKKDVSEFRMKTYTDHLVEKIIAGNEKSPNLPPACEVWLAKKKKEQSTASKTPDKEESVGSENLGEVLEFYCLGFRDSSQVLEDFKNSKSPSTEALNKTASAAVMLAMSGKNPSQKLAALFKILRDIWMPFAELIKVLQKCLLSAMEEFNKNINSTANFDKIVCFNGFLTELFVRDLVDKDLIVRWLTMLMGNWGYSSNVCFLRLFHLVEKKLKPLINNKKFSRELHEYKLDIICSLRASDDPVVEQILKIRAK